MKYKRFGEDIVVRLEVGEEVVASLAEIAESEGVTFAEVSGIGAVDEFFVSVFDVKAKKYFDNDFREPVGNREYVRDGDGAERKAVSASARVRGQGGRFRRRRASETRRRQRDVRNRAAHGVRQGAEVFRRRPRGSI